MRVDSDVDSLQLSVVFPLKKNSEETHICVDAGRGQKKKASRGRLLLACVLASEGLGIQIVCLSALRPIVLLYILVTSPNPSIRCWATGLSVRRRNVVRQIGAAHGELNSLPRCMSCCTRYHTQSSGCRRHPSIAPASSLFEGPYLGARLSTLSGALT